MLLHTWSPHPRDRYEDVTSFMASWRDLAREGGAEEAIVGRSAQGRPLRAYAFGDGGGPTVLLTGLMHGIEVIGSVALRAVLRALVRRRLDLLDRARFLVLPIVNPDAFVENGARVARGRRAWQRCNARGVDLNRNFAPVGGARSWHPFAGSRFPAAPHYAGPAPFSEPETRAVRAVVDAFRPSVSLGFHSFGNMLLYPWGFTAEPNPRAAAYRRLGRAFSRAVRRPFQVKQAIGLYPTQGDLDDWLDAEHDCLAFTVEVGTLDRSVLYPRRMFDPFCWMNSPWIETELQSLVPATLALLDEALERPTVEVVAPPGPRRPALPVDLAAR